MSHVDNYERLMKVGLTHDQVRDFVIALNEEVEMRMENQLNAFRSAIAEQNASFRVHMAERDNMFFGKLTEMSGNIIGMEAKVTGLTTLINLMFAAGSLMFAGVGAFVAFSHFVK